MNNIYILVDTKKVTSIAEKVINKGKKAWGQSTIGENIKNNFKNNLSKKYLKLKNINKIIDQILVDINNKDLVKYFHLVQKSTKGKNFKNLLRDKDGKEKHIKNVAFVFRLKEDNAISKNYSKNSIILNCDITYLKTLQNEKIYFQLNSINFINLPIEEHGVVEGIVRMPNDYKLKKVTNKADIPAYNTENIEWMLKLKKPLDIWKDGERLLLKEWMVFQQAFKDYLDKKEDIDVKVFAWNDKKENLKIKRNIQTKLIGFISKKVNLYKGTIYYINNRTDAKLKGNFRFISEEDISDKFQKDIVFEIEKLDKHLQDFESKLKEIELEIDSNQPLLTKQKERISNLTKEWTDIDKVYHNIIEKEKNLKTFASKIKELKEKELQLTKLNKEKTSSKLQKKKTQLGKQKQKIESELKSLQGIIEEPDFIITNQSAYEDLKDQLSQKELEKFGYYEYKDIKEVKYQDLQKENTNNKVKIGKEKNQLYLNLEQNKVALAKLEKQISSLQNNETKLESNIKEINKEKKYFGKIKEELEKLLVEKKIHLITGDLFFDFATKKEYIVECFDKDDFLKPNFTNIIDNSNWVISDFDVGFYSIIKRNLYALKYLKSGFYKSPYLAISLDKPDIPIYILNKDLPHDGENLNEQQKKAVWMVNNSYNSSFLQGPPGTGKTQVISEIVFYKISKGEICLISSGTNEAINNAMERIDNENIDNPNIFLLRQSKDLAQLKKIEKHMSNKLARNFLRKTFSHANKLNSDYLNLKNFYKLDSPKKKDLLEKFHPEFWMKKYWVGDMVKKEYEAEYSKYIDYYINTFNISCSDDDEREHFFEDNAKKIKRKIDENNKKIVKVFNDDDYINKLNKFLDTHKDSFKLGDLKKLLENFSKNQENSNEFYETLGFIEKEFEKNQKGDVELKLNGKITKIINEKNLVNVIGITTTSLFEIEIVEGDKREIFIDYPIDFAVVDEVSKSITPEIINISILSNGFLFAGDYRQLPPVMDIKESFITDFLIWFDHFDNPNNREWFESINVIIENKSGDERVRYLLDYLDNNLYQKSLFKNQVNKMKLSHESSLDEVAYTFLKFQYRFCRPIQELVNVVYDDVEKLDTHRDTREFPKFQSDKSNNSKKYLEFYDTSQINNDFCEFLKRHNSCLASLIMENADSFNQIISLIPNPNYHEFPSRINEYNAFIGIKLLLDLKEFNQNDVDWKGKEGIGYICMTRSQVKAIKLLIKKNICKIEEWDYDYLKNIKIDTVDNFQGREKDIIIVDLVLGKNDIVKKSGKPVIRIRSKKNVDHYKKCERLNVAVSRAKNKLILLGAQDFFINNVYSQVEKEGIETKMNLFREYAKIIKKHGRVKRVW